MPDLESGGTKEPLHTVSFKIHPSATTCFCQNLYSFCNISGSHHAWPPSIQSSKPLELPLYAWSDSCSASLSSTERDKNCRMQNQNSVVVGEITMLRRLLLHRHWPICQGIVIQLHQSLVHYISRCFRWIAYHRWLSTSLYPFFIDHSTLNNKLIVHDILSVKKLPISPSLLNSPAETLSSVAAVVTST